MFCRIFATASVALAVTASACAQSVPPQVAESDSAMALPGNYFDIPQSAQLKVPLGPPAGPKPSPVQSSALSGPAGGLPLAFEAAAAAEASCRSDGYVVAVAVMDAAGNLKAALAPDGTRANGVFMAMHKAVTVVEFKISTLELRARIERDPSVLAQVKPNMSLLPGGMPIYKDGTFIGAIATSGASAHEEEKCAQAGIARMLAAK